jgi:hypothetical protein
MLGRLAFGWLGRQLQPALFATGRVLRPAWQPALAFLGRGRAAAPPAEGAHRPTDAWAEQVRETLAQPVAEEAEEEGR